MHTMYVNVLYHHPETNSFGGRKFLYQTELPLESGDIVAAPTPKGDAKAMVVETNVPEGEVNPAWADRIKSITKLWTEVDSVG